DAMTLIPNTQTLTLTGEHEVDLPVSGNILVLAGQPGAFRLALVVANIVKGAVTNVQKFCRRGIEKTTVLENENDAPRLVNASLEGLDVSAEMRLQGVKQLTLFFEDGREFSFATQGDFVLQQ